MKAGREGPQGEERRQRVIDMWEAFNAEQLMMKVGELEHVRRRLKNGEQEDARVCSTRHLNMLRTETPHDQYSGDAKSDKEHAGMH